MPQPAVAPACDGGWRGFWAARVLDQSPTGSRDDSPTPLKSPSTCLPLPWPSHHRPPLLLGARGERTQGTKVWFSDCLERCLCSQLILHLLTCLGTKADLVPPSHLPHFWPGQFCFGDHQLPSSLHVAGVLQPLPRPPAWAVRAPHQGHMIHTASLPVLPEPQGVFLGLWLEALEKTGSSPGDARLAVPLLGPRAGQPELSFLSFGYLS